MGTTGIPGFSGTSHFAADLQQAINHSVLIASLPLNELNNNVNVLQGQSVELSTLQVKYSGIQAAIRSLASATSSGAFTASAADNTVAFATLDPTQAVAPGAYDVKVTSIGSPTSTLSNDGLPTVSDPSTTSISSSGAFTLTVGASTYQIAPTSNSLNALAQAINTSGAGVNASLVNLGPLNAPDYRLTLQSTALGDVAIQLNDGTGDLLGTLTHGSLAHYQVDGQPSTTTISSASSTVTIAPGLTVDLLKPGETTVSVASNPAAPAGALSSLVSAYNDVVDELNRNHGSGGGALTGNSIVSSLSQSLRDLTGYSGGSGSVQSLSDLGLTFDKTGKLSFNQSQFSSVAAAHPNDVASFFGSASGSGFLNSATNILNSLEDADTGLFQSAGSTIQDRITADNQRITDTQDSITTLQNNLAAQMSAADALIASLENQVSYFTGLFTDTQNALKTGF